MSKISRKRRQFEIKKRRKKRKKLQKLREHYFSLKTKEEKEKIVQKIRKLVPQVSLEEFLNLSKKNSR